MTEVYVRINEETGALMETVVEPPPMPSLQPMRHDQSHWCWIDTTLVLIVLCLFVGLFFSPEWPR